MDQSQGDQERNPQEQIQQEPTPLAESLKEDPAYKAIRKDLSDKWIQENGQDIDSADYSDFVYGYGVGSDKKTLDELVTEQIAASSPELVERYKQQEDVKVYDNYKDDPKIAEYDTFATVQGNLSRNRAPNLNGDAIMEDWRRRAFDDFVEKYPQKAEAYAQQSPEVAEALERVRENDERLMKERAVNQETLAQARAAERAQRMQAAHATLAELVPGYIPKEEDSLIGPILSGDALESPEEPVPSPAEEVAQENEYNAEDNEEEPLPVLAENPEELKNVIQQKIPEAVRLMSREDLEKKKEELKDEPFLASSVARELLDLRGQNEGSAFIDVDAIVGTVSPAFEDWSTEYDQRKGRAVDIAMSLIQGNADDYERMFHTQDPQRGVKVKKFSGPSGDLFFVNDGTHRVAGAKLAEAGEIPAQVENMNAVDQVTTRVFSQAETWRSMIDAGLIKGEVIEEEDSYGEKVYKLNIDEQILPWVTLPDSRMIEMTKMYASLYPEALTGLKNLKTGEEIPLEVFTDTIAMNFYTAGRWDEYKQKFLKDKEEE